jgi:PBP1b-binding outer membrane lipoprotein LpoB
MKKYILFLIAIATFAMVSCGSGSTTTETTDSAAVEVDTTASVVDSTNVEAPAGGGSDTEQPIK